jgi:two-component sensor histidine kinase
MVPPNFASVLGIMITELVINACKHGLGSVREPVPIAAKSSNR